jgi:hypothetical protein
MGKMHFIWAGKNVSKGSETLETLSEVSTSKIKIKYNLLSRYK